MRLIIDEEAEEVITEIAKPIFKAAQLPSNHIKINLVQDDNINAFVLDNDNVFIFTGLIKFSNDPEVLAGVIAHECAHIALGHISSQMEEMEYANMKMIASTLIGAAAGILSGNFGAFGAITAGGMHTSQMQLLKHSRLHESQADAAAVKYLQQINLSPSGLMQLLKHLNSHERIFFKDTNPYLLTHPISKERISFLKRNNNSKTSILPAKLRDTYKMVVAKIFAFTEPFEVTIKKYHGTQKSDLYAQAIAHYKIGKLTKAFEFIDKLITSEPNNLYLYETKAQFLYENGKIKDAIINYEKSLSLKNTSNILKIELALALIADNNNLNKAITLLRSAIDSDKSNFTAWHSLGIALEKNNQSKYSLIALARAFTIIGDQETARKFIQRINKNSTTIQDTFYKEALEETKIMLNKK